MLVPADVEYTVREYLKPLLSVPVSSKIGATANQVVAFSVGGPESTLVSGRPRLVFDCYGGREAQAWKLARDTFGFIKDLDCRLVGGVQFYDVEPTLPSNLPHPDKPDSFRYQFNAIIHARHVRVS